MDKKDTELKNKYLVLGTKLASKNVASYEWEDIPGDLNMADFDRVIMDLYTIHKNPEKIRHFQLSPHNVYNLIFNTDAEIIVIGIPSYIRYEDTRYSILWWLPLEPRHTDYKGDTFPYILDEFSFYFQLVDEWYFHFEKTFHPPDHDRIAAICVAVDVYGGKMIATKTAVIAGNLYKKPLSLAINYRILDSNNQSIKESGKVIWLPPPTKVSTEEAILEILKKRYQIVLSREEPDYVKEHKLPVQIGIEDRLDKLNQKIQLGVGPR